MSSYLPSVDCASLLAADARPAGQAGGAPLVPMVVFRADDLRDRLGNGAVAAASPMGSVLAAGTLVTFCHPVVSVQAVVRRDGTVLAGGWLPDFVPLGELGRAEYHRPGTALCAV